MKDRTRRYQDAGSEVEYQTKLIGQEVKVQKCSQPRYASCEVYGLRARSRASGSEFSPEGQEVRPETASN